MARKVSYIKLIIPRKRGVTVRLGLLTLTLILLACAWRLSDLTSNVLLLPRPIVELDHFKLNRSLKSYLDNINILIEPSSTVCSQNESFQVLTLVTSSPTRFAQRQAIRDTWGSHVPTYFVIGLNGTSVEDLMVDNYIEAKDYSDMIIFQFEDHYQNLTLKTALMIQWATTRCPTEMMLFKTDDDVLVIPWIFRRLVEEHSKDDLVGYKKLDNYLHRDAYNKWYVPRWLYRQDFVPEYLSGTGYLINGRKLPDILEAAFHLPLINLEDVYFTYIVSKHGLNLTLIHDHRLSPYKPWLPSECMYWGLASLHSLTPDEMTHAWRSVEAVGRRYEAGRDACGYFVHKIWSEWFLY